MTNNLAVDAAHVEGDLEVFVARTEEGRSYTHRAFTLAKEQVRGRSASQRAPFPLGLGEEAIFAPSKDWRTHTRVERVATADVVLSTAVLFKTVQRLDWCLEN